MADRLRQLLDAGVSPWLDFIERSMLHNGDLGRRIKEDSLTGMTSNPTIFEKALAEGKAYDDQIRAASSELSPWNLFELVETTDVRDACDRFRGVYDKTKGYDGYVSIEVSPGSANDTKATIEEAQRLWKTVDRPNVMIKVPGTVQGAAAVKRLIEDGINVNITLLFALEAHDRVIDAYITGLEERAKLGRKLDHVASVASFFVSRVDTEIDKRLDAMASNKPQAPSLKGKAAIANAKLAYEMFVQRFSTPRWKALEAKGARVQRPLWASTSTKNPAYRDVIYCEALIGPKTVNTLPPATLDAFKDHGEVKRTIDVNLDQARADIAALENAGVSMKDVTDKLLADGLASFGKSFDTLIAGLEKKRGLVGAKA